MLSISQQQEILLNHQCNAIPLVLQITVEGLRKEQYGCSKTMKLRTQS